MLTESYLGQHILSDAKLPDGDSAGSYLTQTEDQTQPQLANGEGCGSCLTESEQQPYVLPAL